jgi:flagellar L-ring protein precursor FlgH
MNPEIPAEPEFQMQPSTMPNTRDYNGRLSLGDPGVSASLWQESRGETSLFHDFRAWQPMDIITILVTERAQGRKQADTNLSTESTFQAALSNFFGYEQDLQELNMNKTGSGSKVNLQNLINASSESEFKGAGQTGRSDTLTAQISAMVVEVLPGGVLRLEGERIISMNNEEQIMVISGLARTRDINSENQIDSARIANLRVDYFGRGTVGSTTYGGWLSNILRILWPF